MRIESEDKNSYINLEYLESETRYFPSVYISIDIKDQEFSGFNKVWFELRNLKKFVLELKEIDDKRKGSASIKSMSPEEFELSIESLDLRGNFAVKYMLSKYTQLSEVRCLSLSGGFQLDTSLITKLIDNFSKLMNQCNYPEG